MTKKSYVFLLVLVLLLTGCVKSNNPSIKGTETGRESKIFQRSYYLNQEFFNQSYQGVEAVSIKEKVYGGIIPHHLLAAYLIAEFFEGLEEYHQPEVVVLIGPNHREVGDYHILSSQAEWITPYGNLEPALAIINSLEKEAILEIDERVFVEEHSISSAVAFVKKSFPDAKLVPIVLKTRVSPEESKQLAQFLNQILPEHSLVIASLDFAHEVSSSLAEELDKKSILALESLDPARVAEITVDSPPTITTLFHYLNLKKAQQAILLQNSNAAKVTKDLSLPKVTSYITMYFR